MQERDNFFLIQWFNWGREVADAWLVNRVLARLRFRFRLHPVVNPGTQMTTLEQRLNFFHLLDQVLHFAVPGDVVELGCYRGQSAALFQDVMLRHPAPPRTLHVYDNFASHFQDEPDVQAALQQNFQQYKLLPPQIHKGDLLEMLPAQLPEKICFAHIDCGVGGDAGAHAALLRHCLEALYPRLAPNGICCLMDYHKPGVTPTQAHNPGVRGAAVEFLTDKPETVTLLCGGEYAHAFFRKR